MVTHAIRLPLFVFDTQPVQILNTARGLVIVRVDCNVSDGGRHMKQALESNSNKLH